MKKIILEVYEDMLRKMDEAAVREGFPTRSEFLRYLIVTYLKENHVEAKSGTPAKHEIVEDEFANVDCEFGIPMDVIEKIKKKAGITSC